MPQWRKITSHCRLMLEPLKAAKPTNRPLECCQIGTKKNRRLRMIDPKHDNWKTVAQTESNVQMPCASDWPQLAVNERNPANTSNLPIPQIRMSSDSPHADITHRRTDTHKRTHTHTHTHTHTAFCILLIHCQASEPSPLPSPSEPRSVSRHRSNAHRQASEPLPLPLPFCWTSLPDNIPPVRPPRSR
jgi:hypothetical protein